ESTMASKISASVIRAILAGKRANVRRSTTVYSLNHQLASLNSPTGRRAIAKTSRSAPMMTLCRRSFVHALKRRSLILSPNSKLFQLEPHQTDHSSSPLSRCIKPANLDCKKENEIYNPEIKNCECISDTMVRVNG